MLVGTCETGEFVGGHGHALGFHDGRAFGQSDQAAPQVIGATLGSSVLQRITATVCVAGSASR